MNISTVVLPVVIAAFAGLSFTGGFAINEWRHSLTQPKTVDGVTKLQGYGTRNLKYGHVNHQSTSTKEEAEQFLRKLNTESVCVKQGEPEYELVELFYRRVE